MPFGVLRPVNKTDEVPAVKVAESVDLVHGGDRASQPSHDLCRQLEAQVHALRSDVEEQIARCRRGAALSRKNLAKLSQLGWTRLPEQPVPRFRSHRHDAGKASLEFAKPRRTDQRAEVLAQVSNDGSIRRPLVDPFIHENRSPG